MKFFLQYFGLASLLSGAIALSKITLFTTLSYWWVFMPIILATGFLLLLVAIIQGVYQGMKQHSDESRKIAEAKMKEWADAVAPNMKKKEEPKDSEAFSSAMNEGSRG